MKYLFIAFIVINLFSCRHKKADPDRIKEEIIAVEKAFTDMAAEKGIADAFVFFAESSAVLMRENKLIIGKEAIDKLYSSQDLTNVSLVWKPDFVEVAGSGELAYTYGKYSLTRILENGDSISGSGIFHTIWKKQEDGSWKYVWD